MRLDTGEPFYVGKGDEVRCCRKERNNHHRNIARKCGFVRDRVFQSSIEQAALDQEIFLIRELRTRDYCGGANFTDGGEGLSGYKHTPESNAKNALKHTGTIQSADACVSKSSSMKASSRVKRCEVIQSTLDGQFIAKHASLCAAARAVGKLDAASLVARCCRGKVKSFDGFMWSYVVNSVTSMTRRASQCRKVEQLNASGYVIVVHESIAAAARSIHRNSTSIGLCCRGKRATAYGYMWRFIDAQG